MFLEASLPVERDFESNVQFREIIAQRFDSEANSAIHDLLQELGNREKEVLKNALQSAAGARTGPRSDAKLANEVFDAMDNRSPYGLLDNEEFAKALKIHRVRLQKQRALRKQLPVSNSDLLTLMMTTSVPYIGFGFLDNFIMIMAGESIEFAFGVALGLSMMAAAALGNTLSDVAGVMVHNSIEHSAKQIRLLTPPSLSRFQLKMFPVRMAKMSGAITGLVIGCLLGMVPLLWFDYPCTKSCEKQSQDHST